MKLLLERVSTAKALLNDAFAMIPSLRIQRLLGRVAHAVWPGFPYEFIRSHTEKLA